jgi:spore maturation protein CgeB
MRILYLRTGLVSERDVLDTFACMDITVSEYDAPNEDERFSNDYAEGLFNEIEGFKPDLVFSLRYFSAVSIVCESAKVKYAAWVCKSYEPDIYSCTLLNDCNYIFFADKSLADEFGGGDFKHIFFLPLGVNGERITSVVNSDAHNATYNSCITMMQNIRLKYDMEGNPFINSSPIMDSTRGYLDGCLACQNQLSGLPSMAEGLPPYAKEDLERNFPPRISGDSVETAAHYYDYSFFNPVITYSQRALYFNFIAAKYSFINVNLYNGYSGYKSNTASVHEMADYLTQVPLIARHSMVNLVVTNRNWKSAIPQISLDIMASGGFLISNIQNDFFEVFKETMPAMYTDKPDLEGKVRHYIDNVDEREQIAKELSHEVLERHTYRQRIGEILGKI